MQVCHNWHHIMKYEVGLCRFIGNGAVYNFPGCRSVVWHPIHAMERNGIDKCVFGEVDATSEDDVQGFLEPELVKELYFYGKIDIVTFKLIMDPVRWLTTLKLHLAVFLSLSFKSYDFSRASLRHLKIFYTHSIYNLSFPFNESNSTGKSLVHSGLLKFLQSCYFHRIKIFEFSGPYFVDKTPSLIDAIRLFVLKHEKSLHELVITFPYEWNVQPLKRKDAFGESNKTGNVTDNNSTEKRKPMEWGKVQLSRLVITCPNSVVPPMIIRDDNPEPGQMTSSSWTERILNCLWQSLVKNQFYLNKLQYQNKYEDWTFPRALFSNNARSLKSIVLYVNSEKNVDCNALACCENLRELNLEGNFFYSESNSQKPPNVISKLINLHHLPSSIERVSFSKLLVTSSDLEAFSCDFQKFSNISSIQLYQITRNLPEFGLTPLIVQNLLDQNSISVSFWQAFNTSTFQRAIENLYTVIDRDVMTLMKVLELCDTADGVYENLQFTTLNDCHIQVIRKKERDGIRNNS
ncbi:unnamed protein product [Orchesella dallaii]|uniref:Uncharacterized protein n=1 Tax=Orchesella dallaii TaxID=48710 RepID=A0ABP1QBW8_9HEXA